MAEEFLECAKAKAREESFVEAIRICDDGLREELYHEDLLEYRGRLKFRLCAFGSALEDFHACLHVNSENMFALYYRGKSYLALGDSVAAIEDFARCLEKQPSGVLTEMARQGFEEARRGLAIQASLNAKILTDWGVDHCKAGRYRIARDYFERALRVQQGSTRATRYLRHLDDFERASALPSAGSRISISPVPFLFPEEAIPEEVAPVVEIHQELSVITPYLAALASKLAYSEKSYGDIQADLKQALPKAIRKQWRLWHAPYHQMDGFHALTFFNQEKREALIAFRGTIIHPKNIASDIQIFRQRPFGYIEMAREYVEHMQTMLAVEIGEEVAITVTGHSLGGAIALCITAIKDVPSIGIDNPGVKEILENYWNMDRSLVASAEEFLERVSRKAKSYLAAPNPVNTCNCQIAGEQYRIYVDHIQRQSKLITAEELNFFTEMISNFFEYGLSSTLWKAFRQLGLMTGTEFGEHILRQHFLDNILQCFDPKTGYPFLFSKIKSWPVTEDYQQWIADCKIKDLFMCLHQRANPIVANRNMEREFYRISGLEIEEFRLPPMQALAACSERHQNFYRRSAAQYFNEFFSHPILREVFERRLGRSIHEVTLYKNVNIADNSFSYWGMVEQGGKNILVFGRKFLAGGFVVLKFVATSLLSLVGVESERIRRNLEQRSNLEARQLEANQRALESEQGIPLIHEAAAGEAVSLYEIRESLKRDLRQSINQAFESEFAGMTMGLDFEEPTTFLVEEILQDRTRAVEIRYNFIQRLRDAIRQSEPVVAGQNLKEGMVGLSSTGVALWQAQAPQEECFTDVHQYNLADHVMIYATGQLKWRQQLPGYRQTVADKHLGTGFLISPTRFLTAGHCFEAKFTENYLTPQNLQTGAALSGAAFASLLQVNFRYEHGENSILVDVVGVELGRDYGGPDYAILELKVAQDMNWVAKLSLAKLQPAMSEMIYIVQHPFGARKKIESGSAHYYDNSTIRHQVNTLFGSSGAGIAKHASHEVFAMHTDYSKARNQNFGIYLADIYAVSARFREACYQQNVVPDGAILPYQPPREPRERVGEAMGGQLVERREEVETIEETEDAIFVGFYSKVFNFFLPTSGRPEEEMESVCQLQ